MILDIASLIEKWGIQGRQAGDEFYAVCPLHDDTHPSMNINLRTGAWICFVGCGAGKTIFSLVSRIFNVSYEEAVQNYSSYQREPSIEELMLMIETDNSLARKEVPSFNEDFSRLTSKAFPSWFVERGFDLVSIKNFQIHSNPLTGSIYVPVFFQNEYQGNIERVSPIRAKQLGYRYKYTQGMEKSKLFFGWDTLVKGNAQGLNLGGKVVLCEGPLDTIWMQRANLPALSPFGLYISEYQIKFLIGKGIKEICVALDNDVEGRRASAKMIDKLYPFFHLTRFAYPDNDTKDPQEIPLLDLMNQENIRELTLKDFGVL